MKLLFIIPSYKPAYTYGGPIRSVSSLAESLVQAGHDVMVYTTVANGLEDLKVKPGSTYLIEGVSVRYFKRWTRGHSNFSPSLLRAFRREALQFDVVHIHSWWNFVVVLCAIVCRIKNISPIISPRGSLIEYTFTHRNRFIKGLFHLTLGKYLLQYSTLHLTSFQELNDIKKYVSTTKTIVLPNIINLPEEVYSKHKTDGNLKLIYLSRIDPKKNLELLLNVLEKNRSIPVTLTIIGDGQEDYVRKLKKRTLNNHHIIWKGSLYGHDKFEYLNEADLFILLSYNENFGNVVIESLSQGTPVITSKYVGASNYVLSNNLGWVIDLQEKQLANTLELIWKNMYLLLDIRNRAPGCIRRDFNKKNQVDEYVNMYRQHLMT